MQAPFGEPDSEGEVLTIARSETVLSPLRCTAPAPGKHPQTSTQLGKGPPAGGRLDGLGDVLSAGASRGLRSLVQAKSTRFPTRPSRPCPRKPSRACQRPPAWRRWPCPSSSWRWPWWPVANQPQNLDAIHADGLSVEELLLDALNFWPPLPAVGAFDLGLGCHQGGGSNTPLEAVYMCGRPTA